MIRLAHGGSRVVRLKGGDPMLFGRAGEAIAAAAGISVDVVPGITAGLALAATLGASLTHRNLADLVRFVTGHGQHGDLPADLDWVGLADPKTTLLVYMGGRTAGSLAARLLAGGLEPDTPACAVAALSRSEESPGPGLWPSWSWASRSSRPDSRCSWESAKFLRHPERKVARPHSAS